MSNNDLCLTVCRAFALPVCLFLVGERSDSVLLLFSCFFLKRQLLRFQHFGIEESVQNIWLHQNFIQWDHTDAAFRALELCYCIFLQMVTFGASGVIIFQFIDKSCRFSIKTFLVTCLQPAFSIVFLNFIFLRLVSVASFSFFMTGEILLKCNGSLGFNWFAFRSSTNVRSGPFKLFFTHFHVVHSTFSILNFLFLSRL